MVAINLHLTRQEAASRHLGSCCICEQDHDVREIVDLDGKCPILGRGWGCETCGLPPHGAVAVLCLSCLAKYEAGQVRILWICTGIPWRDGRTPIAALAGTHAHDLTKHVGVNGGL